MNFLTRKIKCLQSANVYCLGILGVVILFASCKNNVETNTIVGKRIEINDSIVSNTEIETFIAPYKSHINESLNTIISYAPKTYSKSNGELNTAIGNLMADAVYEQSNPIFKKREGKSIDFVLLNHGGIRDIISKGTITPSTAYKVMPFENLVVVVALKQKQILQLVNYLSKAKRAHPISKQLQIILNANYTVNSVKLNKEALKEDKIYYVATSDYLFEGGDNMNFFQQNEATYHLNYKVRNVLIDYFKKKDTINPTIDNRFIRLQ